MLFIRSSQAHHFYLFYANQSHFFSFPLFMIINWTAAASSPPPLQSHLTLTLTAAASLGLIWLPVRLPSFPHLISVWCVLFTLSHLRLLHLHRLCPPPPLPSRLPNLVLSHSLNSLVLVDARLFARYLFCTPPPPPLRSAPFTHITARRGRRHWSSLGTFTLTATD